MLPLIVGLVVAALTGGTAGAALAMNWRLARLGAIGSPLLGAVVGVIADALLQLLGAGELRFTPKLGTIDWIPVISTLIASGGAALLVVGCFGVIRIGSRRRR